MVKNNKGFTLIEIIASILLLGIIAAVAGMGSVQVINAYNFVNHATDLAQNSQLSLGRISRSIRSMQQIVQIAPLTSDTSISLKLIRENGEDVYERYFLDSDKLKFVEYTGDTPGDISKESSYTLAENVAGFDIEYQNVQNTNWKITDNADELRMVNLSLELKIPDGTTVTFRSSISPRNTYRPLSPGDFKDSGVEEEGVGCFISLTGKSAMQSLSNNKDKYLYVIWSVMMMIFMVSIFPKKKLKKELVHIPLRERMNRNQRGSVLIGFLVLVVVLAYLGASVVSMISSTERAAGTSSFHQRAYYMAESGYRFLLDAYLQDDNSDVGISNINSIVGNTYKLNSGEQFTLGCKSYWFESGNRNGLSSTQVRISSPTDFPDNYQDIEISSGDVPLPSVAIDYSTSGGVIQQYEYHTQGGSLNTSLLTLTQRPTTVSPNTRIFPASGVNNQSNLTEGGDLGLSNNIDAFPYKNGVFNVVNSSTGQVEKILQYETADYANRKLLNVKSVFSGKKGIPSGGMSIQGGQIFVALHLNVFIQAKGEVGENEFYSSRTFGFFQPLLKVSLVSKEEHQEDFSSLDNWDSSAGSHASVLVDENGNEGTGDAALKVTGTDEKTSSRVSWDYKNKNVKESTVEYGGDDFDFDTAWATSDKTLSYELQAKVSFQSFNDKDAANSPYGTYMPGIIFRVKDVSVDSNLREYFGMSFVRAITGESSGSDFDGIPDNYLFQDHGSNRLYSESQYNTYIKPWACSDSEYEPPWNDEPPISGMPYIMFWQHTLSYQIYDDGFWRPPSGGYTLNTDWITYYPLCTAKKVTVYHYPDRGSGKPERWTTREISGRYWNGRQQDVYELEDTNNIFVHNDLSLDGSTYSILGETNNFSSIITDADGIPIENRAYIYPSAGKSFQEEHNYRLYLKPWVTIHARIFENKGDFYDENRRSGVNNCGSTTEERVNTITANFSEGTRGTIEWPDDSGSNFKEVIWADTAYSSKIVEYRDLANSEDRERTICDRGDEEYSSDDSKRSEKVKMYSLTTEDYDAATSSEVGLHTFGINADAGETAYFDDFAIIIYKSSSLKGLLQGAQYEM